MARPLRPALPVSPDFVRSPTPPTPPACEPSWRSGPSPPPSSGTRLQWTFAADGSPAFRTALRLARPGVGHTFRTAARRLDRWLAGSR